MVDAQQELALQSAVAALRLKDIALQAARFSQPTPFNDKESAHEFVKRAVGYRRSSESLEVQIELGVRIAASKSEDAPIHVEIEADFIACYEIRANLSDEAIKAFATFNAVHNVWPFWRQHVFDIVNRAHLFPIEIPLFSGRPLGGVDISKSKPSAGRPIIAKAPRRRKVLRRKT